MKALACHVSDALARAAASVWVIYVAAIVCAVAWVLWPPTDPFNSAVSDVSLVMLFVLTRSGDRDTQSIKAGTQELVRAMPDADGTVMVLDDAGDGASAIPA